MLGEGEEEALRDSREGQPKSPPRSEEAIETRRALALKKMASPTAQIGDRNAPPPSEAREQWWSGKDKVVSTERLKLE